MSPMLLLAVPLLWASFVYTRSPLALRSPGKGPAGCSTHLCREGRPGGSTPAEEQTVASCGRQLMTTVLPTPLQTQR